MAISIFDILQSLIAAPSALGASSRPLWRDAPSLFEGLGSTNVEDLRANPKPTSGTTPDPTGGPPPGMELPNQEEMQRILEATPPPVLQGRDVPFDDALEYARYRREVERKTKELGLSFNNR